MKKKRSVWQKAVPLWLTVVLILNSSFITFTLNNYFMKRELTKLIVNNKSNLSQEGVIENLKQQVLPQKGYQTALKWKNLGKELISAGAIDKTKFENLFANETAMTPYLEILDKESEQNIVVNEQNSRFLVNFFWALGLTNKSKVLDEGTMGKDRKSLGNFASTGGWTLGARDAVSLYSSKDIIPLTSEQQDLVKKIAENVFRPCCNNPTSFPDCNHGMAALGYIEWAAYNGLPEDQIYKDLLAFNSFWFPQTYIEQAAYFSRQGIAWNKVDPKLALSSQFSSATGSQKIREQVQDIPGIQSKSGGCGV